MLISKGEIEDIRKYHLKWIAQRKFDGVLCVCCNGILKGRNGTDLTKRFPHIANEMSNFKGVFVGELICDSFKHTCQRAKTENQLKSRLLCEEYPAKFMLFDCISKEPYCIRYDNLVKEYIKNCERINPYLDVVQGTTDLVGLWERAKAENWEGIVIKNPYGLYEDKRTKTQLKVKFVKSKDIVFDRFEVNNAGIKLFSQDKEVKIQCSGSNSIGVKHKIENTGSCLIEVEYLNETESGKLRMPVFKVMK